MFSTTSSDPKDAALRVLLLEDVATDAELVERELRQGGVAFVSRRVSSRSDFQEQLTAFDPDVLLADFHLPGFDGLQALSIAREKRPDLPVIFVSGAIGEDRAIDTLKQGATDYVLKDRLSRLVPAVRRALGEAVERKRRQEAETALERSEERHRLLLAVNNAIISSLDRQSLFRNITEALSGILTFDRAELTLLGPRRGVAQRYTRVGGGETSEEEILFRGQPDVDTGTLFSIPLMVKGRWVGALALGPNRYRDEEVDLLAEAGKQVVLAIENLLAYEEIDTLKARLEQENTYLQEEIQTGQDFGEIIGKSPSMKKVLEAVRTVAPTVATVLICGETGTGKEVVARAVHGASPLRAKPLVKVNCAALPATLIESELFGHEKGAFTGALVRKIGRFELAHGGTIFLDEIGELPIELQAKLLRVLQEGELERVGGSRTIQVNVRVIAATNRELKRAMEEGRFRPDLYYRLAVFPLDLPPLRERKGDIPLLASFFARELGKKLGKSITSIPAEAMARLSAYGWPGNIRELRNVIERAAILTRGSELALDDWWSGEDGPTGPTTPLTLDALQRKHILSVLDATGWRVSGSRGAARLLGINPTTLTARMKKLGIHRPGRMAPALPVTHSTFSPSTF